MLDSKYVIVNDEQCSNTWGSSTSTEHLALTLKLIKIKIKVLFICYKRFIKVNELLDLKYIQVVDIVLNALHTNRITV
jgi:hypothetical protein